MIILPRMVGKRGKRVGRGYGSGKGGHTVGKGQKGQKTRSTINVLFEGMKVKKSLLKRLPFQRGKGKFAARLSKREKYLKFESKKSAATKSTPKVVKKD